MLLLVPFNGKPITSTIFTLTQLLINGNIAYRQKTHELDFLSI